MSPDREGVALLGTGVRLGYSITGPAGGAKNAPYLLLCRPLGGSMALWGDFAKRLSTVHRVIAFDPRGVGDSSDAPLLHSTREMARDAVGLLDFLGVERTHVFGLSLGGMVASWIAIDAPDRVMRLVLASTLPQASAISVHVARKSLSFMRCFTKRGVEAEVCLVTHIFSGRFRREHPGRVLEIASAVRENPTKRGNLLSLAMAAARHNAEPGLKPDHRALVAGRDVL
jgi:pimeloyl-ACP methyl ester carboxylesterase